MFVVQNRKTIKDNDGSERGIYTCKEISVDDYIKLIKIDYDGRNKYFNFWISFDTETCKVYKDKNNKYQITCPSDKDPKTCRVDYIYMMQISVNQVIGYLRNALEFKSLINKLNTVFKKYDKIRKNKNGKKEIYSRMCRMYGFNASYDFMFIKDLFKDATPNIGYKASEMISWNITSNIEFVDAQLLVGNQSLKDCVKDAGYIIPKDGIDHSKFRTPATPLNDYEIGYALDDVYYLDRFLEWKLKFEHEMYKYIGDLPYTKTMEVVNYIKKQMSKESEIELESAKLAYGKSLIVLNDISEITSYKGSSNRKRYYIKNTKQCGSFNFNKKYNKYVFRPFNRWMVEKIQFQRRCGNTLNNYTEYQKEYELLEYAFAGGFTHANMKMLGKIVKNVACTDLSSAYPSEMLTQKFVYSYDEEIADTSFYDCNTRTIKDSTYGYLMHVKFRNLRTKRSFGCISKHKCIELNGVDEKNNSFFMDNKLESISYDNGRVTRAEELEIVCTDIDINSWSKMYSWSSIEFITVRRGKKYRMNPIIIEAIAHFYNGKCEYKNLEQAYEKDGNQEKYDECHAKLTLAKQKLNSIYGMSVKNDKKFRIEALNSFENDKSLDEVLESFYKEKCKYEFPLTYAIGVQVTAYTRKRILDVLNIIPDDKFVYSDTDSIYFIYDKKINESIDNYSSIMQKELKEAIDYFNIDTSKWYNEKHEPTFPSLFDTDKEKDGSIKLCDFITTGAKRYCKVFHKSSEDYPDKDFDIKTTVAGVSKKVLRKYIMKNIKHISELEVLFQKGIKINESESNKKHHKYVNISKNTNKYTTPELSDFIVLPDNTIAWVGSWVSLYDVSFEMSYTATMTKIFKIMLNSTNN